MMDWLKGYNLANVIPFIKALGKTRKHYYPDKIDMLKDVVSIPGISMTYVLNKALNMKGSNPYAPGQPCIQTCGNCSGLCMKCRRMKANCMQCAKNKPYELLKTGMIGARPKYHLLLVHRGWKVLNMQQC